MIPQGAEAIIAARVKGKRPADMVLVALEAPPSVPRHLLNPVVVAKPGIAYDWRWALGLDVGLYVSNADDWGVLVKDIALQRPAYLCVWNYEEKWGARVWLLPTAADVERPKRQWKFDIDFSLWHDFQNRDFIECREYRDTIREHLCN